MCQYYLLMLAISHAFIFTFVFGQFMCIDSSTILIQFKYNLQAHLLFRTLAIQILKEKKPDGYLKSMHRAPTWYEQIFMHLNCIALVPKIISTTSYVLLYRNLCVRFDSNATNPMPYVPGNNRLFFCTLLKKGKLYQIRLTNVSTSLKGTIFDFISHEARSRNASSIIQSTSYTEFGRSFAILFFRFTLLQKVLL